MHAKMNQMHQYAQGLQCNMLRQCKAWATLNIVIPPQLIFVPLGTLLMEHFQQAAQNMNQPKAPTIPTSWHKLWIRLEKYCLSTQYNSSMLHEIMYTWSSTYISSMLIKIQHTWSFTYISIRLTEIKYTWSFMYTFPQQLQQSLRWWKISSLWASNELHWAHSVKRTYSHTISKLNWISTSDTLNWSYPLLVSVQHPTHPVCGEFFNHLWENFRLYSDALLHAGIVAITYLRPGWHGHIVTGL